MINLHSINDFIKMEFEHYKIDFLKVALDSGYSEQNITKCLNYAKTLYDNKLPVIYNISHLSSLVGYKKEYIKRACSHPSFFYRDFEILKKNGKKRTISEPLPSLKEIQLWILENILNNITLSPFAKAYRKKVTLKENLKFHKNQPKVFTLDIDNFFPSIKIHNVYNIFLELGYSDLLSITLSKLCTKDNTLPQGAPTSPYLSNIYFKKADERISKYCIERKIMYTRYADDLSFSGDFNEIELYNIVKEVTSELGFLLNESKTKLMRPNTRQTVTGIVVNKSPQVVFYKRNELRNDMYFIKKYGIEEHIKIRKIKQKNYLEHLMGKIGFVLQINPQDKEFKDYKDFLFKIKQNTI